MKTLIISDIKWDVDEEDIENVELPKTVYIANPPEELLDDYEGEAENICNYLSDEYGFCVLGFTVLLTEGRE